MQEILYDTDVFVVWGYADALEAYRSDVIDSIQTQPDPGGNIYGQDGYWSWWSADACRRRGGSAGGGNTGVVVGVAAGAAVVLAGGAFLLLRRRSATADERE